MRKFFPFRSSTTCSGKDNPVSSGLNTEKKFNGTSWESVTENFARKSQNDKESTTSKLQRSASFTSPACYSKGSEGNNFQIDMNGSLCNHSHILQQNANAQVDYISQNPERFLKSKRKNGSPNSFRGYHGSTQSSCCSSPVPLRCRSACIEQTSEKNRTFDIYVEGEQQQTRSNISCQQPSCTVSYYCVAENRMLPSLGHLPIFHQHTAPVSPNYGKDNMKSYLFKEEWHHACTQDHTSDDLQPLSPQRHARKIVQRLSHVLPGNPKVKLQDSDSETTTTIEDIFEDTSDIHYSSNPNSPMQKHDILDHKHALVYEPADGHCRGEALCFQKQTHFLGDDPISSKLETSLCLEKHEEELDSTLHRRLKEIEERTTLLPEMDAGIEKLQNGNLCMSTLAQMIRNINEDRKYLTSELSSQLRCRIAERSSMKKALRQAKIDLDTRTRRLEQEKFELQSNLENELDRRSSDWLFKFEKFQSEEQKLRERMRELAEQNVSFQREISSLSGREMEARNRMMDSEVQCDCLATRLEEARNENEKIHQVLSELQEHCDGAKEDQDCIRRNYKEKEKENKELQKAIVRLQRICNEQEKTINGLRQAFSNEIIKQSSDKSDLVTKMQIEQARLMGVEQKLRREVESYRFEVESLRHENVHLLERLRGVGIGHGISFFKLDQELHAWIDCLKNQGMSLLDGICEQCVKLLEFIKGKQYEHAADEYSGYLIVEYSMNFQSLRKAVESLRCSLQMASTALDEKSNLGVSHCKLSTAGGRLSSQCESEASVDELEYELKVETLLTRVLREKLCYKELELEQLQAELANSVGGNEILRFEIQRLQDDLSCLRHKTKEMELQMLKKDDNLNQLQCDLQGCTRELTIVRGMLPNISEERDRLWEEVKHLKEINMLLECEVKSLKKKIEALDEDILIKEGQLTMLKDSLGGNPLTLEF